MMADRFSRRHRVIRTADDADLNRLEAAWSELEHALAHGDTAGRLDVEDLDRLICDLVAIRHRKLSGAPLDGSFKTVVTERGDDTIALESHIGDEISDDLASLGPP
jgi:hypothetical protein